MGGRGGGLSRWMLVLVEVIAVDNHSYRRRRQIGSDGAGVGTGVVS